MWQQRVDAFVGEAPNEGRHVGVHEGGLVRRLRDVSNRDAPTEGIKINCRLLPAVAWSPYIRRAFALHRREPCTAGSLVPPGALHRREPHSLCELGARTRLVACGGTKAPHGLREQRRSIGHDTCTMRVPRKNADKRR